MNEHELGRVLVHLRQQGMNVKGQTLEQLKNNEFQGTIQVEDFRDCLMSLGYAMQKQNTTAFRVSFSGLDFNVTQAEALGRGMALSSVNEVVFYESLAGSEMAKQILFNGLAHCTKITVIKMVRIPVKEENSCNLKLLHRVKHACLSLDSIAVTENRQWLEDVVANSKAIVKLDLTKCALSVEALLALTTHMGPTVQQIALEECGIDDSMAGIIAKGILKQDRLKALDLSKNRIGAKGAKELLLEATKGKQLQSLSLAGNRNIGHQGLSMLCNFICVNPTKLKQLDVTECATSVDPKCMTKEDVYNMKKASQSIFNVLTNNVSLKMNLECAKGNNFDETTTSRIAFLNTEHVRRWREEILVIYWSRKKAYQLISNDCDFFCRMEKKNLQPTERLSLIFYFLTQNPCW